jgi:hypothetical protein
VSEAAGTLELVAIELGHVMQPIEQRLASGQVRELFAEMGLQLPAVLTTHPNFTNALATATGEAAQLPPLIVQLETAIAAEDVGGAVDKGLELLTSIQTLITSFETVATELDAVKTSLAGVTAADVEAFAAELATRLLDFLLVRYLEGRRPLLLGVLELAGFVERAWEQVGSVDPVKPPYLRRTLRLERIPQFIQAPDAVILQAHKWGAPDFTGEQLLPPLRQVLEGLGVPATLEPPLVGQTGYGLRISLLRIRARTDLVPPGLEAGLFTSIEEDLTLTFPLTSGGLAALIEIAGRLDAGLAITIQPPADVQLLPPTGTLTGSAKAALVGQNAGGSPFLILGRAGQTRVEADRVSAGVLTGFRWDAGAPGVASGDIGAEAEIQNGRIVISLAGSDGFLSTVLPPDGFAFDFDFLVGWSASRGLYFAGSGGLEAAIGLHVTAGPITLETLYLALTAAAAGIKLETSVSGSLELGPIAASVDRVGAAVDLKFQPGNLGPLDLGVEFKPPNGLGLAIDAAVVKGGGYLYFDFDNEEYAGVLELSLKNIVQVKAIGLLTTRLPGGVRGFSLLLIITAEFPPIQLSFGFTLNGVGGLIGVNRTMVTDVLRAGLRTHTLDSVLFPHDPVRNAPKIISDLRTVFPPAQGRYVFGPMLKIGWGTPTLIEVSVGVLIELPAPVRIAILGQIKAVLPSEDAAVVRLNLDVLGVIDFERKSLSIDASLYDSIIVVYTLEGDMALRLNWGENPTFALSVGGLHPRFPPPPEFPELRRLTLSMGTGDNPRLSCSTYIALTSNSVQFGARVELFASAAGFSVRGYLGFDVLIILSPFSFEASMEAGVELLRGSSVLMSLHLDFLLSGPTPWRARGNASFKILFVRISVGFDVTWGDDTPAILPPADAKTPLLAALADSRNWAAELPAGAEQAVSLAAGPAPASTLVIHPLGRLTVRERVVPLDVTINRFGSGSPDRWNHFTIAAATLNGASTTKSPVDDLFALGQFFEMSNEDKLSKPSFERKTAGATIGATSSKRGHLSGVELHYETVIIDDPAMPSRLVGILYRPDATIFSALIQAGAAAFSPVLQSGERKYVPPGTTSAVKMADVEHTIVSSDTLERREDVLGHGRAGRMDAEAALGRHLTEHPEDTGKLQVVPLHEVPA